MSAKHTPGPWIIGESSMADREITTQDRLDKSYGPICEIDCYFEGQHGVEQEANSRLIAAAPDLLESLVNIVGLAKLAAAPIHQYKAAIAAAEAAIRKALGEDQ